jgi:hypothetical protein
MGNSTRGSKPYFVYATDFDGCFRHLQNLGFQMADKMAEVPSEVWLEFKVA